MILSFALQLAVEREELMRELRIESSNCSKLKVFLRGTFVSVNFVQGSSSPTDIDKMHVPYEIIKP
jgi:hypothetical protein